jgi:hypothetical protein
VAPDLPARNLFHPRSRIFAAVSRGAPVQHPCGAGISAAKVCGASAPVVRPEVTRDPTLIARSATAPSATVVRLGTPERIANSERGENSRQVSTIVRTLGTTVIAVGWLFSGSTVGSGDKSISTLHALEHNSSLRWCVLAALVALGADLLQYLVSTALWSTYHWAVDQVDINDDLDPQNTATMSRSVRVGWSVLRLFRMALQLEYELDLDNTRKWEQRRTALRAELARSGGEIPVQPPAWLNVPGLVLFFGKVAALAVAWVELFIYLSNA